MRQGIPIIDLFAGPGGLGEGFSSLTDAQGEHIFQIVMSVEMEKNAHQTLRLRSFFRKIYKSNHRIPAEYLQYIETPDKQHLDNLKITFPQEWEEADREAVQGELKIGDNSLSLRYAPGETVSSCKYMHLNHSTMFCSICGNERNGRLCLQLLAYGGQA